MPITYAIIENGQPMDGVFLDKRELFITIPFAKYDAMIIAIDLDELRDGGTTPCRDVTEDMTVEWWGTLNRTEREELAELGRGELASRFIADEYAAAVGAVEAA